jgi:His-Xaa-Ser system protein HxsD
VNDPAVEQNLSDVLCFSGATYSLGSIKKAAYRFSDRCAFEFEVNGDEIICRLFFPKGVGVERARAIEDEFRNEVLDQDLREAIGAETAAIRNAILAYAFSRTGLQNDDEI